MKYRCPNCGVVIEIHSRCWVCSYCGEEACGLGSLEVEEDDQEDMEDMG